MNELTSNEVDAANTRVRRWLPRRPVGVLASQRLNPFFSLLEVRGSFRESKEAHVRRVFLAVCTSNSRAAVRHRDSAGQTRLAMRAKPGSVRGEPAKMAPFPFLLSPQVRACAQNSLKKVNFRETKDRSYNPLSQHTLEEAEEDRPYASNSRFSRSVRQSYRHVWG